MRKFPEAFAAYADRRLMGEVEQALVWRAVLEKSPETSLRSAKAPFHYLKDLRSLEEDLTRERIGLNDYAAWLDERAREIEADPALQYAKGERQGELNARGREKLERLGKGRDAIQLITAYRAERDARGLYGYTDVLRIAVDALAGDEALRADLQEQYQYVLADEHQDANALQHALLDALAYDEHPNLFIVGDEKQAVFGFQGADSTHFRTFLERYPRTTVVALAENFRSYQGVLDLAHTLLADLPSSTGEHVELSAHRGAGGGIQLLTAPDPLAERDQVAALVEAAIKEGVAPHEIAVITNKNKTADLFALHLRARGVPTLRAGTIDLDGRPSIRFLLALMQAAADPNDLSALREALIAPWWNEPLAARAALMQRARDHELISELAAAFPALAKTIAELQREAVSVPPVSVFSHILADSGARAYFLSGTERVSEDIPLVRQLMMHIEDLVRAAPNATFAEVMRSFAQAREHEIGSIKTSLTQREGQITVITAHKAKGMEFERVFIASLTAREWEGRGRSGLIPSPFDKQKDKDEIIRLFYVALTRAKNELVLSYAAAGSDGKEQAPLSILPPGIKPVSVPFDPIPLMHAPADAGALVRELTLRYLEHDGLSPSAYNEYLQSPPTFFAKRVLRLREPETRAIVVGNGVHAAIAAYLRLAEGSPEDRMGAAHAELARCLKRSLLPRGDTFDQLGRHARALLDAYVASPLLSRKAVAIEDTFAMKKKAGGKDILLKGKVDALFAGGGGECIVDFKTSSQIDKKDKGKFERQIAFYDLLLRANGHGPQSGLIVQITEDGIKEHPIDLSDAARAELRDTLDAVLAELLSGGWRAGEPSEYDDLLTLFAAAP